MKTIYAVHSDNFRRGCFAVMEHHAGSGTASYSYIWGMAGENLDCTDKDAIAIKDLK